MQKVDLLYNSSKDEVNQASVTLRTTNKHLINAATEQGLGWAIMLSINSSLRNREWSLLKEQADKWKQRFGPHSLSPNG